MNELGYAKTVISRVHVMTFNEALNWTIDERAISSDPTPEIHVRARFDDVRPDSAIWESACIKNPVGKGVVLIGNPKSDKARLYEPFSSNETILQINDIFRHVLLEPRQKAFDEAMKKLAGM